MNIGNSSSVQASSSQQPLLNITQREITNRIHTCVGRTEIQQREAPGKQNFVELQTNLVENILPFVNTAEVIPPTEPEIEPQETSLDGKWHAWRNAEQEILWKPANTEGPVKRFLGEQCEEFSFCPQSQYLMIPQVEMLSSQEMKAFFAEQMELLRKKNANLDFTRPAALASTITSFLLMGGDFAIVSGILWKGALLKVGTLLIAPIWLTSSATVLLTLGAAGTGGVFIKNKIEKSDLIKNIPLPSTEPAQAPKQEEQAQEETIEMQEPAEEATYQRITLHFEPTREAIKPKASKIMYIKGTISSSVFSADKKHFFTVVDGKTIKQWSTKTGKIEKNIEPCAPPTSTATPSVANKPASITELKISPRGKWLLLAEVHPQDSVKKASMWLYSRQHGRIQSHFSLTTTNTVQFEFSPCERSLAVLEGGHTLLRLTTESGEFQRKRLDPPLTPIQRIHWVQNELQVVGADNRIWKIIPVENSLYPQLIPPLPQRSVRFSMLS